MHKKTKTASVYITLDIQVPSSQILYLYMKCSLKSTAYRQMNIYLYIIGVSYQEGGNNFWNLLENLILKQFSNSLLNNVKLSDMFSGSFLSIKLYNWQFWLLEQFGIKMRFPFLINKLLNKIHEIVIIWWLVFLLHGNITQEIWA